MKKMFILLVMLSLTAIAFARPEIFQLTGRVSMLRVHEVGTKYGPHNDQIDVEAVVQLNTQQGKSFGFKLRNDGNAQARQGMLDLLREAFTNNWNVTIEYDLAHGKNNGILLRVWVTR